LQLAEPVLQTDRRAHIVQRYAGRLQMLMDLLGALPERDSSQSAFPGVERLYGLSV
jgi:hypothetical protein